jgi:hypothetical protein
MTQQQIEKFNPREHLMSLKRGKGQNAVANDYLPVQWRLVWFRNEFPEGSIETEVIMIDLDRLCEKEDFVWNDEKKHSDKVIKTGKGIAVFKATVKTGQGGSASATGSESAVDFGDFIEKAETKAIGRALAALGFGTQFAPELNEGERIVDAPVEKPKPQPKPQPKAQNQIPPRQIAPATKEPEPVQPRLVSSVRLNEIYNKGKRAGLYLNTGEFVVFAQLTLGLDILADVKSLTDAQANDVDAEIVQRASQQAS